MLKNIINRIYRHRHPWRSLSFDELSELYTSTLLRSLANSLIGIFVPVYLYKLGLSIHSIFGFYAVWFVVRPVYDYATGHLVARFGPKHIMALATIIQIVYLSLLMSLNSFHWPLWLLAQVGALAMSLYLISINTDFSKVKHSEHGGKEIGYLANLEKFGGVVGPLLGGLLASFYDPRYAIALAIILQVVALIPLFMSQEVVRTHQVFTFRGLPWRRHTWDYISAIPFSVENYISVIFWPLFLAVAVLGDHTFAKLGIITAISTGVSMLATHMIGRLIDESRGGELLRTGTIINAGLHLVRPFVRTFSGALAIDIINNPVTAAYRMPYIKGFYDAADSVPGYRIAYLTSVSIADSSAKLVLCSGAWLTSFYLSGVDTLRLAFVVAAIASLAIMLERFPALRRI